MPDTALDSQTLELVSLWEDAICLHAYQKALIPADLRRAKKRLAKLSSNGGTRQPGEHPFFFYRICVVLARQNGSATMGELSTTMGIPLSTATRLVDRLTASGYLTRLTDPDDHRIVRITLSERGQQLYQTIQAFAKQRVEAALRCFTTRERKDLVTLLRKAVTVMADLN